jgi:hypothetical protein
MIRMSKLRETSHLVGFATFVAACILAGCALSMCLNACAAAPPVAEVTPAAAEGAYTAELLRCVDQSQTREQSRTCRAGVDRKWGVDGGAK